MVGITFGHCSARQAMDDALKLSLERQAVEKCRAGVKDEYHVIFSLHSTALFRTEFGITRDYALSEDVVQDTFIRAWKKFNSFQPNSSLRNWLTRILVNRIIDLGRRKQLPTVDITAASQSPLQLEGLKSRSCRWTIADDSTLPSQRYLQNSVWWLCCAFMNS